jgi:hypothetical protein
MDTGKKIEEEMIKEAYWNLREKIHIVMDNLYFDLPKNKGNDQSEMSMLQWFESTRLQSYPYTSTTHICF